MVLWLSHDLCTVLILKGVKFELGAVTVDPRTPSYNPRPLISYLAALGIPYFYEEQGQFTPSTDLECALCEGH